MGIQSWHPGGASIGQRCGRRRLAAGTRRQLPCAAVLDAIAWPAHLVMRRALLLLLLLLLLPRRLGRLRGPTI